jgi:hypothetical protein
LSVEGDADWTIRLFLLFAGVEAGASAAPEPEPTSMMATALGQLCRDGPA